MYTCIEWNEKKKFISNCEEFRHCVLCEMWIWISTVASRQLQYNYMGYNVISYNVLWPQMLSYFICFYCTAINIHWILFSLVRNIQNSFLLLLQKYKFYFGFLISSGVLFFSAFLCDRYRIFLMAYFAAYIFFYFLSNFGYKLPSEPWHLYAKILHTYYQESVDSKYWN